MLNKSTVSILETEKMNHVFGGEDDSLKTKRANCITGLVGCPSGQQITDKRVC